MSDIRLLFADVDHAEDVVELADGRLAFGGELGQIYVGDPSNGHFEQVATTGGRCLGMAADAAGFVYVCDPGRGALVVVDLASGQVTEVTRGSAVRPFVHPNSIALLSDGSAFVSDSGHWGADDGVIYYIAADATTSIASESFPHFPNGIAVSPKNDLLYVVESRFGLSRSAIRDGELAAREEIVPLPDCVPDGLALCLDGSILLSCYQPNQILTVEHDGRARVILDDWTGVELSMPTNIAFYGADRSDLAIANLGSRHIAAASLGFQDGGAKRPARGPVNRKGML